MPKGICPKCGVRPVLPKRSYCRECGNEWQNAYQKIHPQKFTEEQRERQRFMARQRIANMTPEEKKAYYDRKFVALKKRLEQRPDIKAFRNAKATVKRAGWSQERREIERQNGKAHFQRRQDRAAQGLCEYSMNCMEPPIGKQARCMFHWCVRVRHAHTFRVKPEFTAKDLMALWQKQEGKCAITGITLVPGENAALDHIVPVVRNGSGSIDNLRFIHQTVNRAKWDFIDDEFEVFVDEVCPHLLEWARKRKLARVSVETGDHII